LRDAPAAGIMQAGIGGKASTHHWQLLGALESFEK